MDNNNKVCSITKENYQEVANRAQEVKNKLEAHHIEHGGFPSLRWAMANWNCPMSLKAMCRHRAAVAKKLNVEIGKPTHVLPRPKRKKEEPSDNIETATIEPAETTEQTEEAVTTE